MLKIWESDAPYDIPGEFWNVRIKDSVRLDHGVGGMLKPLQKPHPPIATSVMSAGSFLAKLAGQRGWIPISANFAADVADLFGGRRRNRARGRSVDLARRPQHPGFR